MDANLNREFARMDPPSPVDARPRQHKEKVDPRTGSGPAYAGSNRPICVSQLDRSFEATDVGNLNAQSPCER
jgi:hypothetical protein